MTTETMTTAPFELEMQSIRRFTVEEYYRMAEVGILHEDDRVELIDGRIVEIGPIGSSHSSSVKDVNQLFRTYDGSQVTIGIQDPIRFGDGSEPLPDISVLRFRPDNYRNGHLGPSDILLIIEVSDTSLAYDRNVKLPLYAGAGIAETWIVNLAEDCLEVYRDATDGQYQNTFVFRRGEMVSPEALPGISLSVSSILPGQMKQEEENGQE
jgi:Uma2 family endonuclease